MAWTVDEIRLALRLTTNLGHPLDQVSRIMVRHGSIQRTPKVIADKLAETSPKLWATYAQAQSKRLSNKLAGVVAPRPPKRIRVKSAKLDSFVAASEPGLSEEDICWAAREAGFDCNITDIAESARRCDYVLLDTPPLGIDYSDAIMGDLCLWPVGDLHDNLACGGERIDGSKYCGPHVCRALGSAG